MDFSCGSNGPNETIGEPLCLLMTNSAGAILVERKTSLVKEVPPKVKEGGVIGRSLANLLQTTPCQRRSDAEKSEKNVLRSWCYELHALVFTANVIGLLVLDEGQVDGVARRACELHRERTPSVVFEALIRQPKLRTCPIPA